MAIVGVHDFAPENGFRTDLLNAIETHDFHWDTLTFADKDSARTVTLRCTCALDGEPSYGAVNPVREDVVAALHEHAYELQLFQLGDKDDDRVLTVKAVKNLTAQQTRLPGT